MLLLATAAQAQVPAPGRVGLSLEGLSVRQERNDVRIPPEGGTPFSIVDLIGSAETGTLRAELTIGVTEKQELRFVYAPLRITGQGTTTVPIDFAGGTFPPGRTDAEFKFSSYRGTWRYRIHQGPVWTWRVGVTAFIRDARIALSQPGVAAEDTDVGFVPLGHLAGVARLSSKWHFGLDVDATAAPQGRAIDLSTTINYQPVPRLTLSAGYRTIEGGADVERVYTFAWLNAATARIGVRF